MRYYLGSNGSSYQTEEAVTSSPGPPVKAGLVRAPSYLPHYIPAKMFPQIQIPARLTAQVARYAAVQETIKPLQIKNNEVKKYLADSYSIIKSGFETGAFDRPRPRPGKLYGHGKPKPSYVYSSVEETPFITESGVAVPRYETVFVHREYKQSDYINKLNKILENPQKYSNVGIVKLLVDIGQKIGEENNLSPFEIRLLIGTIHIKFLKELDRNAEKFDLIKDKMIDYAKETEELGKKEFSKLGIPEKHIEAKAAWSYMEPSEEKGVTKSIPQISFDKQLEIVNELITTRDFKDLEKIEEESGVFSDTLSKIESYAVTHPQRFEVLSRHPMYGKLKEWEARESNIYGQWYAKLRY
jgi:hypothetical protein